MIIAGQSWNLGQACNKEMAKSIANNKLISKKLGSLKSNKKIKAWPGQIESKYSKTDVWEILDKNYIKRLRKKEGINGFETAFAYSFASYVL